MKRRCRVTMFCCNGLSEEFVDESTLIVVDRLKETKNREEKSTLHEIPRSEFLFDRCVEEEHRRTTRLNGQITVLLFENKLWESFTWSNAKSSMSFSSKSNIDKNCFKRKQKTTSWRPNIRDTTESCPKKILSRQTKHTHFNEIMFP